MMMMIHGFFSSSMASCFLQIPCNYFLFFFFFLLFTFERVVQQSKMRNSIYKRRTWRYVGPTLLSNWVRDVRPTLSTRVHSARVLSSQVVRSRLWRAVITCCQKHTTLACNRLPRPIHTRQMTMWPLADAKPCRG